MAQHSPFSTIPCPHCHRIVHTRDRFCGFCNTALQAQCSECGGWTKANHQSCPACGAKLHTGGLSFQEKQQLQKARQTYEELQHASTSSAERLVEARRNLCFVYGRQLLAGLLAGLLLIFIVREVSNGGIIAWLIVLTCLFLFQRPILAVGRWVVTLMKPEDVLFWRETIEEEREQQAFQSQEMERLRADISALENQNNLVLLPPVTPITQRKPKKK